MRSEKQVYQLRDFESKVHMYDKSQKISISSRKLPEWRVMPSELEEKCLSPIAWRIAASTTTHAWTCLRRTRAAYSDMSYSKLGILPSYLITSPVFPTTERYSIMGSMLDWQTDRCHKFIHASCSPNLSMQLLTFFQVMQNIALLFPHLTS